MKGKRLLILGAAFALGLSACANSATLVRKNPFREADPVSVTWAGTTALPGTATPIEDSDITIMVSATNTYSDPIRVYANTTITIGTTNGATINSVTYESSSTGNYVTVAQQATVTPSVTPTVNGKNVTWTLAQVTEFTFKPSAQTRTNGITVNYNPAGGSGGSSSSSSSSEAVISDGLVNFGSASGSINVNATSVSGSDNLGVVWTVTTVIADESFTANSEYAQIGAAKKPATSIDFDATLNDTYYITSFSAKFGGFSGTAGDISLKVGTSADNMTQVGSGSLNGTTDVVVTNTSFSNGSRLSVNVSNIAKGVKAYYISYTYQPVQQGDNYTVTFDTNGGTAVSPQSVSNSGEAVASIPNPAPTKNGYIFAGWYSNEELTEAFNFNAPITDDVTIYANWIKMPLSDTYSVSSLTNDTYYRIAGEVTAIAGSSLFFIQNGNNSMQIYNGALAAQVSVGNTVDLCGKYVSNYSEITDLVYYEITSTDTTNSQVPLTSLNDATVANQFKYFEISKLQLGSAFSSNKASIKGNDTVTVYYKYADHVNGGSFDATDYSANDYVSVKGIINVYNSLPQLQIVEIRALDQCIVTFDLNGMAGATEVPSQTVLEGDKAQQPDNPSKQPDENYSYEFVGWYTDASCADQYAYNFNSSVSEDLTLYAKWNTTERTSADVVSATKTFTSLSYNYDKMGGTTDVLDREFTGRTGTGYGEWKDKIGASGIVYAGQSAAGNDSIQLRTENSNSGVIVTSNETAHTAKKVTVSWDSHSASGRTIDIYGSDVAYEAASDLFDEEKQGTKLGSIVYGTSVELVISEEYNFKYIGIRSASSPLYLSSISIQWGDLPSFSYNVAVRFGGLLSKTLWDKLDTDEHLITGYGLLIATTDFLDGDQLKDYFDLADNVYVKKYETNGKTPTLVDGNYGWNLFKRLGNENLTTNFTSVAFIKLGDQVVFFDEVTASAKSLANDLINADNEYSRDSFEGSLGYLADLH